MDISLDATKEYSEEQGDANEDEVQKIDTVH
jgi:hypothetical protein